MGLIKALLSAFYPNTCVGCDEIIDEDEVLCEYCSCMIEKTELDKFCFKCGNIKKECKCRYNVFYFDGCVSPYYNEGIAKKIVYGFKFHRKERNASFIAHQMALAIKQGFYNVSFDCVCCVPIEIRKGLKRGYNQSRILALELANVLGIPYYDGVLYCNKKKRIQHSVTYKERFKNVEGVYFVKTPLKNKTVLLVDDIKTSGATLSECAKQLLSTGSQKVYCITALTTKRKGNKNGN